MKGKVSTMEEIYPVLQEVIDSGGEFRLYPRGSSMRPLLREGRDSVVLVAPKTLKKRDICLYRRQDGSFVLHRILRFDKAGEPIFCGDNQLALEYGIPREAIIAVVDSVYRKARRVSCRSLLYRLYVRIHCCMLWRRVLHLPRRIRILMKRKRESS